MYTPPKYFRPLTVLIPNCIYMCDIIHPLVRYHGRSRRSPAPTSRPLGGLSSPLGGPLVGPSVRAVRAAVRTLEPRASLFPSVVRDCYHPIYMVLYVQYRSNCPTGTKPNLLASYIQYKYISQKMYIPQPCVDIMSVCPQSLSSMSFCPQSLDICPQCII